MLLRERIVLRWIVLWWRWLGEIDVMVMDSSIEKWRRVEVGSEVETLDSRVEVCREGWGGPMSDGCGRECLLCSCCCCEGW